MDEREFALRKAIEVALLYLIEMELAQEHIGPDSYLFIRRRLEEQHEDALEERRKDLTRLGPLPGAEDLHHAMEHILELLQQSCEAFCGSPGRPNPALILRSFAHLRDALELLYPLRKRLPGVANYFLTDDAQQRRVALDPDPPDHPGAPPVGMIQREAADDRGALTLYVPEYYLDTRPWPLIVALHGGSGTGRGFVWTWLREAKSRGYLLAAPSSRGSTWDPSDDGTVAGLVDEIAERYNVDRGRVLLTGMSDGATFTFIFGFAHPDRFTALAPLCGVLHPALLTHGYLENGKRLPVYMVHGAKDWIFPIETARVAAKVLAERKIDHVFRELPGLSHAYPRRENEHILNWFEEKAAART